MGSTPPTNPGANEPPECTLVLQVEDSVFNRYLPEEGFDCGEDHDLPFVVPIDIG